MTDPLPPEKLERLLPALKHVADLVRDKGELSRDDLQLLLLASGMDEDWAVSELERWTKVLVTVRGENDERKKEIAVRALMLRGVPEAPAKLAVEVVTELKPPEPTKRPVLPIKVSKEVIGFGELQPGQGAEATLVVSGGPGKVKVGSDMIKVEPDTFGPEETVLKVTVKGGLDGQVLWDALILESEAERVKVEIVARWSEPTALVEQETIAPVQVEEQESIAPVQEKVVEITEREIVNSLQEPKAEFMEQIVEQKPVTPKVMPALSLRGFFTWKNLVEQGMVRRLGRGIIKNIFLLNPNLVLVISTGGAGLFDLTDGQALWEIDCPTEGGAISPDGSLLALIVEKEILLVAIGEKTLLWSKRMEGHTGSVLSVSFSPDGKFIASGSGDNTVRLWDVSSGKEIRRMEGHTDWVRSVSFSPDGKFIASGSEDGTVRIWRVR